jgi:hypothetical protein
LALLGGTVATACASSPPTRDIDALVGQLKRAQSDGELAGNAATAAPQKLAATLNTVAGQRAAHAKALSDEITRISGEAPPTTSATSVTSSPTTTSGPPPKPPTAADVVAALQQSADGASLLATQQSGYRAGLLGSIAAACTAAATVALTGSGQAP